MHKIDWPGAGNPHALNRFEAAHGPSTALIVIDLQAGFVEKGYPAYGPHALDTVAPSNRLATAVREAGGLVIFTRQATLDDPLRGPPSWQREREDLTAYFASLEPGSAGHALYAGLDVREEDLVIDKVRYSAFLPISSPLDEVLRARGIDTVIITGTVTNVCCESSARDAHMLGYRVFFIADATAAATDQAHNASLAILGAVFADVRMTEDMIGLLT